MIQSAAAVAFIIAASSAPVVPDIARPADPRSVHLEGLVGERIARSEKARLLALDEERLLRGFRHRPGEQAWIGEHVGKWLHAGSLAWANTRDPALREKLDRVVRELLKTQEPDGYLGTYIPAQRFGLYPNADWDVWVHKYCLLGLLTYHEFTGDAPALEGARRAADLLLATFGPGKKDIVAAGTHVGMAATSVLEPVVLLHRATGEKKYLDFARSIVESYDHPKGPGIVKSLLDHGSVRRTANAKAYEMMSNLVGLCELYRETGERKHLEACERAWKDIVENRMYLTGGVSLGEHFQDDGVLPNSGAVSETCAQVTWEQLNLQLLRLTGDPKYADVLERIVFNHLLGAQKPDGSGFCYFTPLSGKKPYGTDINCCTSSGPRGMALIPTFALTAGQDSFDVHLPIPGSAELTLGNGKKVKVTVKTDFPSRGKVSIEASPRDVAFRFAGRGGLQGSAEVEVPLEPEVVPGGRSNPGRVAVVRGPVVYCLEPRFNPHLAGVAALAGETAGSAGLEAVAAPTEKACYPGQILVKAKGVLLKPSKGRKAAEPVDLLLGDYASAGADGGSIEVWLPLAAIFDLSQLSLLSFGKESWSRPGNAEGGIADGDRSSYRVTFDGRKAEEDWFAVELDEPAEVVRVVFVQGRTFHDGGWFDASKEKPRIQVRRAKGGDWETVASLEGYPAATAGDRKGLREGQRFEAKLAAPVSAAAVRVIGRPASGDNPAQAFSSCAELEAYER